jgi:nucleoside-diphosphate-sugar epimerase
VIAGAEAKACDLETAEGARSAVAGAAVVYMAAQPPYDEWPQRFPAMLRHVMDATASEGAKLVMVDNLYAYGPVDGPMVETTPERATDRKGAVRHAMTEMLMDAHRSGRLRVAIGRASDYYGPGADNSTVTALAVLPAIAGKTARWVGRDDVPHSIAYLPDIARAYVALGTSDLADGAIWHLPHPPAITGAEIIAAFIGASGGGKSGVLSRAMLRMAGLFHAPSRELLGIWYQWSEPYVVDDSRFRRVFGPFDDTPFVASVRATVASPKGQADVTAG